ncbi:MAG: DUF6220 domain-containing protein [Dermatophilaceae bacterium]
MRTAYRALAYIIAAEVAIQAAAVAYGLFGLGKWIDDGGTLDKAVFEDESATFTGVVGFAIHGINGTMVIPLLALVLLLLSFFARVPGGAKWAGAIFALVIIQVLLGTFAHVVPQLGPLHGINALVLFSVAVMAARRVSPSQTEDVSTKTEMAV